MQPTASDYVRTFPETVAEFEANEALSFFEQVRPGSRGVDLDYFRFCPWCGTAFDAEWWRGQPLQNARVPDHFRNPGSHAGDEHRFVGAVEGHALGSTDPTYVCWCQPEVEPSITGCVITHTVLPPPEALTPDAASPPS